MTKNTYLRFAFLNLIENQAIIRKCLIVDIDSYSSLSEMISELDSIYDDYIICYMIKGAGLNSKILSRFTSLSIKTPLSEISQLFNKQTGMYKYIIVNEILNCISLAALTKEEKQSVKIISKARNIPSTAKILNLNPKTVGSRVRSAMIKLNLRNVNELRKFIIANQLSNTNFYKNTSL